VNLNQLPLTRLHFDLETLEEARVPAYQGDLLRMALLWWLSEYWYPMSERCRHGCRQPDVCLFGRLCEPAVNPEWPGQIRHLVGNTPPPAYILWDREDRRRVLVTGSQWSFELTLVGELALRQLPAVVAAVQQGAQEGMGRVRLRSRVLRVLALPGSETVPNALCLAEQRPHGDGMVLTWEGFHLDEVKLTYQQAIQWAEAFGGPIRSLSLRYLSPVKIKERGEGVDVPYFSPIMKAIVRRLRILSVVHGAGEWPHSEWGPLLDLAETVHLEHKETFWTGYTRHSKQSGRQEVKGFVGQAWYSGQDLRPLLPILWLGQWLHIGKAYVLGNGRYVIEQVAF
jgi:hypothetical protein